MKRKATLVILVLFQSLLFSCKQPKEEGGSSVVLEWGGSLETTTISYEEPLGGSYDANRTFKEKEPVNLYDLGLEQDLGELPPSYLIPWFCRNDGVLDPFFEKKPSDLSFGVTNQSEGFPEKRKDKLECFSPQSYLYITSTVWYAEVSFFEQGNYVCFYDFSLPQYNRSSAMNNPFMDAVYANGVWSYVVTFEYDPL
ncbi:MAG: hypothetical protein J5736_05815, partial [Bacilli bacterium]|nr:hypothetical protein [Bacilli bacterium]